MPKRMAALAPALPELSFPNSTGGGACELFYWRQNEAWEAGLGQSHSAGKCHPRRGSGGTKSPGRLPGVRSDPGPTLAAELRSVRVGGRDLAPPHRPPPRPTWARPSSIGCSP